MLKKLNFSFPFQHNRNLNPVWIYPRLVGPLKFFSGVGVSKKKFKQTAWKHWKRLVFGQNLYVHTKCTKGLGGILYLDSTEVSTTFFFEKIWWEPEKMMKRTELFFCFSNIIETWKQWKVLILVKKLYLHTHFLPIEFKESVQKSRDLNHFRHFFGKNLRKCWKKLVFGQKVVCSQMFPTGRAQR